MTDRTPHHQPESEREGAGAADVAGIAVVLSVVVVTLVYLFRGGAIVGIDSIVGIFPMYELLGNRLAGGELPLWNPTVFSGMALAADPQSGWLYVPVMVAFGLAPVASAALLLSAFYLLLASLGMYALARVLGLGALGATIASVAFMGSGWFTYRLACCPADSAAAAWLPVALVTTELALRAESPRARLAWQLAAAIALTQVVSAWFGQGAYYSLLVIGGYLLYRTLIAPARAATGRERLGMLARHLAVVGSVSLGLAAGGLLPRLENYRVSNLADGYPQGTAEGWGWFRVGERLLGETSSYIGNITVALAIFGLLMLRGRTAAPFWTAVAVFAVLFASETHSILHSVVYAILPTFEQVQGQLPNRIIFIAFPGLAIMAGGVAERLVRWRASVAERIMMILLGTALVSFLVWADDDATSVSVRTIVPAAGVVMLAITVVLAPPRLKASLGRVTPVLLLIALIVDLGWFSYDFNERQLDAGVTARIDLEDYYEPAPSARFLMEQAGEPFRFLGIDPSLRSETGVGPLLYGRQFMEPITAALVVNNRSTLLGLEDIQGVNAPMTIGAYGDFFEAMTGETQNYHNATLLTWSDLNSPLLDLLNVRYIIVPLGAEEPDPEAAAALARFSKVYADEQVRILENPGARPRAWLVHELRVVEPGAALPLLATGDADGAEVALIEGEAPGDLALAPTTGDEVAIVRESPEQLRVTTQSAAPGLLVFSEITHPGWQVFVDGERADLLTVNHALMAVAVPAGGHTVELRFVARLLRIGLAITAVTGLAVLTAGVLLLWPDRSRRPGAPGTDRGTTRPVKRSRLLPFGITEQNRPTRTW